MVVGVAVGRGTDHHGDRAGSDRRGHHGRHIAHDGRHPGGAHVRGGRLSVPTPVLLVLLRLEAVGGDRRRDVLVGFVSRRFWFLIGWNYLFSFFKKRSTGFVQSISVKVFLYLTHIQDILLKFVSASAVNLSTGFKIHE